MFSILKKRKEKKNNIHRFIDGWMKQIASFQLIEHSNEMNFIEIN